MPTLARLNVILGLSTSGFATSLNKAQRKLRKFGRDLDRTGSSLRNTLTLPALAAGSAAVKMAVDFETSMDKIVALVGVSREQVDKWSVDLLKLGPELGKAPAELAEALFFITSASYRGSEAIDVLVNSAKASSVGLGNTAQVADAVTSAVTAYGRENLNAADATAILLGAVREGKAGAEDLAPVLGGVIGVAAEMGVEFHEVAASLAAMTQLGTPASRAVTQLSSIFSTLTKGSEKTRKGLAGVGLSLEGVRATLKTDGLLGLLTQLKEKFGDNEDAAAEVFGSVEALRGVFALVGKSAETNVGIFGRLAQAVGSDLNTAFAITTEGSGHSFKVLMATIAAGAITLGKVILPVLVPLVEKLADFVGKVTTRFSELDPQVQNFILGLVGAAVALGPFLIALGLIATGLGTISTAMIGWTVAVGGGVLLLAKHWEKVKLAVASFVEFIKPALAEVKALALEAFGKIKAFALEVWPLIQEIAHKAIAAISEFWLEHGETIIRVAKRAWNLVKLLVLGALDAILTGVEALLHVLNNDWPAAWGKLYELAAGVFDKIRRVVLASILRMRGGWLDFGAAVDTAMLKILLSVRTVVDAWTKLPFIDPIQRKVATTALTAIDAAMGGIALRVALAKTESKHLNEEADKLIKPIEAAKKHLVQYSSGWITVGVSAEKAADKTKIAITRAGEEITDKLKGGFGRGVEEGAEEAKTTYDNLQQYIADNPLRPTLDLEHMQRQLNELGLSPDTGGGLP